ncbi:MAG TPA: alpha/beta hydrolase domain-containing protein [Acidimicrobiales bacterium]|nr:alpha/beta hydrolase domain-containing protein [Acidimicrobiales bacterium]
MTNPKSTTTVALVGLLVVVALGSSACGTKQGATAMSATRGTPAQRAIYGAEAALAGPVTTGHVIEPLSAHGLELAVNGYTEQEFFASGTAHAFKATSSPRAGKWSVTPTTSASYQTRILVRRPTDPAHFNGTVVVEWMNVSSGESAPDWDYLNPSLMRDGYAYVAVSAQSLGVDGGTPILGSAAGGSNGGLVGAEPDRYGTLHHPGDQYAMDMFAQIGTALRAPKGSVLGGLRPKQVVATGESQSAFYLTTFADALQPLTGAFDGIFIHSRGGAGAPLSGSSITSSQGVSGLQIRTDLNVPVFIFETQTDLVELGYAAARQPNTNRIRTWEVAGTSHADEYLVGPAASLLGCTTAVNAGPQHEVVQAAFAAFHTWVTDGTPPAEPPPFRLDGTNPVALALDGHGNVIGGVRTPAVDVPVSTLSGAAPPGASVICALFGSTTPFSESTLVGLYRNRSNFVASYQASLDKAIAGGYILKADRAGLLAQAQQVAFPS